MGVGVCGAAAEAVWKLLHQDHMVDVVDRDIIDSDRTSARKGHAFILKLDLCTYPPPPVCVCVGGGGSLKILLDEDFPSTAQ